MAKQNRTTLKGYFETGDIPTGGNYVDLIDSPLMLNTENTGSANILGTITASGDISSSGTGSFTGGVDATGATGSFAYISSSGDIKAANFGVPSAGKLYLDIEQSSPNDYISLNSGQIDIFRGGTQRVSIQSNAIALLHNTSITGNVTASGNISASGTISAFGSSSLVGLPTTEPSTTGALWLSGSGGGSASGSKYLMVFTG